MPDSSSTPTSPSEEEESSSWEVNVVTKPPRRRRDPDHRKKSGGRGSFQNKKKNHHSGNSNSAAPSFGSWSKPAKPPVANEQSNPQQSNRETNSAPPSAAAGATGTGAGTKKTSHAGDGFMMQDMSALLAEYGEFDPHWMDKQPDHENVDQVVPTTSDEKKGPTLAAASEASTNRLGPQGKAPLHIDVISFGFRYGAPSTRRDGWSQTQPLLPFDCRDVLPAVPAYMQFHDGLSSGPVKRFLLYDFRRWQARQNNNHNRDNTATEADDQTPSVREYSVETVAPQIYEALLEAVRSGDYGYAQPLKMQMFIGSEWGRHRSVVAAEQTASALRKLLRHCQDPLPCPCSVATQHRDVDRKMPCKKSRDDNDD